MRFTTMITSLLLLICLSIQLQAYEPAERFSITCGSTGDSDDGARSWTGDIGSALLLSPQGTVSAVTTDTYVPFQTARVSRSQFTYSFPVTAGPKFLRLFFYPYNYSDSRLFQRTDASFTVKSGEFTLLRDFNASLNADADSQGTVVKEYIMSVEEDQNGLNVTFIPTKSQYAFVNGIEVLSMPSDLYYTPATDPPLPLIGTTSSYSIETNAALETLYRISIGSGDPIGASQDTGGLLREWANNDVIYLKTPSARHMLPSDIAGSMNVTVNPDYVAPVDIYKRARTLGSNGTLNKMLNLTWEFTVDAGFYYMLRLHFCDLDPKINQSSDRVFIIYIAGQLADDRASVLKWTDNKRGVAVHRDYVVFIPNNDNTHQNKFANLSVQLHPYSDYRDTTYSDPFLNGLEIFKISDVGSNNLAGPNPLQSLPNLYPNQSPPYIPVQSKSRNTSLGVRAVVYSVLFVLIAVLVVVLIRRGLKSIGN